MLRQKSTMGNKPPPPLAILIAAGAIQSASPDEACPGLHWKPLDATIGQLLAPHCPGRLQDDSKQNNSDKCTNFAGRFAGHGGTTLLYHTHCPMKEVQVFHRSH
jgi:hypothetical protein